MTHFISHAHCFDGSATMFAFRKYFGGASTNQFYYLSYDDSLPKFEEGDVVYIGDYSRHADELLRLFNNKVDVIMLDHHESALVQAVLLMQELRYHPKFELRELKGETGVFDGLDLLLDSSPSPRSIEDWIDEYHVTKLCYRVLPSETNGQLRVYLDTERCGAYLTWQFLFPGEEPPLLFKYIDTRDRWVWELPDSEEVTEGWGRVVAEYHTELVNDVLKSARADLAHPLHSLANSILDKPDYMTKRLVLGHVLDLPGEEEKLFDKWLSSETIRQLKELGAPLVQQRREFVEEVCRRSTWCFFMGHWVPIVEAYQHYSWVGNRLAELHSQCPFAVTYKVIDGGKKLEFSLRSRKGVPRVNRIAEMIGGGGHREAAGTRLVKYQYFDKSKKFGVPDVTLTNGVPIRVAAPVLNPDSPQADDTYVFELK